MRSILDLLTHLRTSGASLTLVDGGLRCNAPKGLMTPALRSEIAEHKPAILKFLEAQQGVRGGAQDLQIEPIDRGGLLPLSYAQQRLWFLNQLDPGSTAYNIGAAMRMTGGLNLPALQHALSTIVLRHEDLRTCFRQKDGMPHVVIEDGSKWRIELLEAEDLVAMQPKSDLMQAVAEILRQPFDIARGPLFRAQIVHEDGNNSLLLLAIHHIIADGWSMGVFGREFAEIYTAFVSSRPPELPDLKIQYADFAAWQHKWLASGRLEQQMPFWKTQLSGAPPLVGFPADHTRPTPETFRARRAKLTLPEQMTQQLEDLSQRNGVTLFMTLLAAFCVLLSRYSGLTDIVVGSPSANRTRPELNPLIGFFVNTLVLRTDLSGDPTFADLLDQVREVTLKATEHQDVPFDQLVSELRPDRSMNHSPLFQVMFALQNFPFEDLELPSLKIKGIEMEPETARFDLTVEVFPRGGRLHCYFDYKADLYEHETIVRLQNHFSTVLNAVVLDPECKVASIPLLSPTERENLLRQWNFTQRETPALTFNDAFEFQARNKPTYPAVQCGDQMMTYGGLEERADHIASMLLSRGARSGTLIALFLERTVEMVAAMLAIGKAGAAYIPLDPAYPKGRIAAILDTAKPLLLLTTTGLMTSLPEGCGDLVCLDDPLEFAFSDYKGEGHSARASACMDDLAYVIFTSGSTGTPKGVEITHAALSNFLESMRREPGFAPSDVLLAVTTISFDIAGLELLLPLYTGGTVCVAIQPGDPDVLRAEFDRFSPTVMQATPATWKMLIASGWRGDSRLKILCGGEALDAELAKSLLVRSDSLWNMYGPTETTIWSAVIRIEDAGLKSIPVGLPIQNTTFYVLDERREPVPAGVAGELWIGGKGLARGYLHRDDLTTERFLQCPFEPEPRARMYRTGDLVRYRRDGTLEFFGRLDHQVKLRGYRIELGEIEAVLRTCNRVLDAVTVLTNGRDHTSTEKRLAAYLVYAGDVPPDPAAVREHLRQSLPKYMVPTAMVFLKALPRLPNGKLDRSALPAPEASEATSDAVFAAPDTDLQHAVAEVFCRILKSARVGVDSNFFDLGANSLLIVRVHVELNRMLQPGIPLISFFQYPTVRTLARFIESSGQALSPQLAGTVLQGH